MTFTPSSFSNSAATSQGFALIIVIPKWVKTVNFGLAFANDRLHILDGKMIDRIIANRAPVEQRG